VITSAMGNISKVIAFRLGPGEDLMKGIEKVCEKYEVKNAVILSAMGSLQATRFFDPVPIPGSKFGYGYSDPIVMPGVTELLSAQGTVSHGEDGKINMHVHFTVANSNGICMGGHLIEGNECLITLEVVIGVLDNINLVRKYDNETEMNVLHPENV